MTTSENISSCARFPGQRIAVIGAGQSGLCAIRHFAADTAYDVVAFEQSDRIGGLWSYPDGCEDHVNLQDETSPFFCRMYRNLVGNTAKTHMMYAGNPDWADRMEMFPSRKTMCEYLSAYADAHDLLKHIKMKHVVKSVVPCSGVESSDARTSQGWKITTLNLDANSTSEETFDVVIICNGQYRKPHLPAIPSLDGFHGAVLHSGEYRNGEKYKDHNVLVIGSSVSANDMVCQLQTIAKNVLINRRMVQTVLDDRRRFPNVHLVPEPLVFTNGGLTLNGGEFLPVDSVILATGYVFNFPFLTPECGIQYSRGRTWPLYRHMINCEYPTMAFIGCIQKMIPVMPVVEDQIKFYKAWLDGVFSLPSAEEMKRDCKADYAERLAEGMLEHSAHKMRTIEQRLYPYLDSLAKDGRFQPWSAAMKGIFLVSAGYHVSEPCSARSYRFTVIDESNFHVDKTEE